MADEDGSKPKYEVEEISIKTRVQKILDLSTTRSDLLIGLSYCKNRTKTILLPDREYFLQSTKHSFTLHLMYIFTLYDRILFRLNKKSVLHSIQIGDQWRLASCSGKDPSIQDQAWESIPLFACPRHNHLVISPFLQKKHCFPLFFQPQDVADLVSSEVRNFLSKINGMVYKSRHKNKRFAEGIFITPFPLLRDNTSSALSSYVSVFFYIYHLWEAFTAVLLRCIVVKTLITLYCPLCL